MRIRDWSADVCSSDLCHAVPHGVNARVDDVAARKVNGPGNSVEKPRMVRGINRDQSRPAIGIDFRGYGERTLPRAQDMPGILEQNVVCLCDQVGFRETLAQRRKFLVRKPSVAFKRRRLALYPTLRPFLLCP